MKIKTCTPQRLPLKSLNLNDLLRVLGRAHEALGRFDDMIGNHSRLVSSVLLAQETYASLHSQRLKATMEQIFAGDRGIIKIINYQDALIEACREIYKKPLSLTMMRKIHGKVKKDSAAKKDVGRFRDRQNWIGPEKCKMKDAYFFPPVVKLVPKCMANLQQYWQRKENDALVQLAVFFAQLLIIHPFMDGNGRVARACIPLFLFKKKITSAPLFYMSPYFKHHRLNYFTKLYEISSESNWEEWLEFFLKGIVEQGKKNCQIVRSILSLYEKISEKYGEKTARALFARPVFNTEGKRWTERLKRDGVIKPYQRHKPLWVFTPLIKIAKVT